MSQEAARLEEIVRAVAVESMRGLVHEVLRASGFRDQWPGLVPVAQGIVDLMARGRQQ